MHIDSNLTRSIGGSELEGDGLGVGQIEDLDGWGHDGSVAHVCEDNPPEGTLLIRESRAMDGDSRA